MEVSAALHILMKQICILKDTTSNACLFKIIDSKNWRRFSMKFFFKKVCVCQQIIYSLLQVLIVLYNFYYLLWFDPVYMLQSKQLFSFVNRANIFQKLRCEVFIDEKRASLRDNLQISHLTLSEFERIINFNSFEINFGFLIILGGKEVNEFVQILLILEAKFGDDS